MGAPDDSTPPKKSDTETRLRPPASSFFNNNNTQSLKYVSPKEKKRETNLLNIINNQKPPRSWDLLKIATHNINGLNKEREKLLHLVAWAKEQRIPIIRLAETNINSKVGNIYNNNDLKEWCFFGIWSEKANKIKG